MEAATLNPNLREFWRTPARNRVLYGGRSSSKSWDAAGFAIFLAQRMKLRFLCTRQFQNRIADSVYTLLKIQAERFGIDKEFRFLESSIQHRGTGSEFVFYGLARNISEIKSLEGIDVAWHEECHLMTKAQWEIIDPTLRKQGSQHWLIFNPLYQSDFVYQRFVVSPPPNTLIRHINFNENPFLSGTIRSVIDAAREENYEDFEHIYLGVPLQDDERAVIKRSWIEAAIDADITLGFEPDGASVVGFDIADGGPDKCAVVHVSGSVALDVAEWSAGEDELLKSCSRAYNMAAGLGASLRYDSIGVGASAGAKFDELNSTSGRRVRYSKFNAGGAVHDPDGYYAVDKMDRIKNRDHFANIKAQTWWHVADRFRNTYDAKMRGTKYDASELISIRSTIPHLEKLKTELSTPHRDYDQNGRVKVESKKDLDKRDIASPNIADAFVMCYAPMQYRPLNISASALAMAGQRPPIRTIAR